MSAMKRLFQLMAEKKASDIFLSVGAPINIKINGNAVPVNQTVMTPETVKGLLYEVLNEKQIREYEEELELNTAYALDGVGAFRISAFRQKNSPAVVVRFIPGSIPPLDSLGVPEVLKEVIMAKRGLILMVGATGSGKSTSLSSMIDYRNERKAGHILTLEDPVEFIFQNKKSIVNQREVGTDTKSFTVALKNALRQAPDIILIGEIRDKETAEIAITASLTGHFVFSTVHTNDAAGAITRLVDMGIEPFLVASSLVGLLAQRLVRRPCYECARAVRPDEQVLNQLGLDPAIFYRGGYQFPNVKGQRPPPAGTVLEPVGCPSCLDVGYRGRTGIYEMLMINEKVRHLTLEKADAGSIRAAAAEAGMISLRLDGARKVVQGLTTTEEVMLMTAEADL